MTTEEVLQKTFDLGIKRDLRTLQRYAKKGLVPKPVTRRLGRGKGSESNWPESTPYEFYASAMLISALSSKGDLVAHVRRIALSGDKLSQGGTHELLAAQWISLQAQKETEESVCR